MEPQVHAGTLSIEGQLAPAIGGAVIAVEVTQGGERRLHFTKTDDQGFYIITIDNVSGRAVAQAFFDGNLEYGEAQSGFCPFVVAQDTPDGKDTGPDSDAEHSLFASVASGVNWPLGDMTDLYDPSFMFAIGLERAMNPSLRVGFQAGYHAFDADTALSVGNLKVTNLSLFTKFLGGAGSVRTFSLAGPGAYRVHRSWEPGIQAGLGAEVPVSPSVALTTGTTAHFVLVRGGDEDDLTWVDGWLGFLFRLP